VYLLPSCLFCSPESRSRSFPRICCEISSCTAMMSDGLRVYCSPHSCESLATSVRDTLANRRRARHLARLKELVDELGRDAVEVVKPTLLPLVANTEAARQPELKADSKRRLPGDELANHPCRHRQYSQSELDVHRPHCLPLSPLQPQRHAPLRWRRLPDEVDQPCSATSGAPESATSDLEFLTKPRRSTLLRLDCDSGPLSRTMASGRPSFRGPPGQHSAHSQAAQRRIHFDLRALALQSL
jgi:hypothetical protein